MLSSRECFPPTCNATLKYMYSWSGFTWPAKCEVTTRLTHRGRDQLITFDDSSMAVTLLFVERPKSRSI